MLGMPTVIPPEGAILTLYHIDLEAAWGRTPSYIQQQLSGKVGPKDLNRSAPL